jgi:CrcB protein
MTWIAVALGGGLGSMGRHAVNVAVARILGQPSPLSTALVNIAGCAVIGVLAGLMAAGGLRMTAAVRTFVFVGILGGFTTFSSFGLDTLTLAHDGRPLAAAANVLLQVSIGLAAVFIGFSAFATMGTRQGP